MDSASPPVATERVYAIAYQEFAGSRYNRDFRGKGALRVRSDGAGFVFTGTKRGIFIFSRGGELVFAPDQIWNVQVEGRRIQFATRQGESGRKEQLFVFFAPTDGEALEIAAGLPQTKDADAIAGQEFAERLQRLSPPARPWQSVTNLIVAANVAVFVVMGLLGAGWFEVSDLMPYIRYGANRADITTDGEWWRLVTSMFLHYGILHLLLNMWALLQAGHLVERLYGRALYFMLYFGSGIAGSMTTLLWHHQKLIWSAGASGAVFGVYGGLFGYMMREKQALPKSIYQPLLKSTLLFAGYNLFYGMIKPNIDNAAHLGGLVGGAVLGWLLALPLDRETRARLLPRRLMIGFGVIVLIVGLGVVAAPRFGYRLMDEIAFQEVNKAPVPRELEVLKRQQQVMTEFITNKDRASLPLLLANEVIPFYTGWRDGLLALKLEPGRRTARHRDAFAEIIGMKIDAYRRLLTASSGGDANAVDAFRADEEKIAEELKKLPARVK